MTIRIVLILALLATPAFAQRRSLFGPPKPKVIATPTPTPTPKAKPVSRKKSTPKPAPKPEPAPEPAEDAKPATEDMPEPKPLVDPAPAPEPTAEPKPAPKPAAKAKPNRSAEAYIPSVKAAFADRWVDAASPVVKDFSPGSVNVVFKLDAEGKPSDVVVTDNTSNDAFAEFCKKFVMETAFEKPPEKALTDGQIEIPFTFKVY